MTDLTDRAVLEEVGRRLDHLAFRGDLNRTGACEELRQLAELVAHHLSELRPVREQHP